MSLNDFMKNTFLMSLLRDISLREVLHPQVQRLLVSWLHTFTCISFVRQQEILDFIFASEVDI